MPSFVGRAAELRFLGARLEEASSGVPRTVVVTGSGGVGKSALLRSFTTLLGDATLLSASGEDAESTLSYGVLHQLLGRRSGTWPDAFAAGRDLLDALEPREDAGPTVLLVDDAHVADADSLTALSFALRRLHADPVLAVIAARSTDGLPGGLLRLAEDQDGWLPLRGLTVGEVVELAGTRGHPGLSRQVAERLRQHTGGNALHLRALMDDLSTQALGAPTLPAPRSYGQLVLRGLAEHEEDARRLTRALSVLPERSPLALVAGVAGVEEAAVHVDALTRANLLQCAYDDDGWRLSFAHPMVRASVADDLGPEERRQLHLTAASLLAGETALLHRVEGATGTDAELAGELAEHAARRQGQGDAPGAARLYLKAAALGDDATARGHALLEAADLLLIAGDMAAARRMRRQLEGLPGTALRYSLQARIDWFGGDPTAAERLAEQGWESAGHSDERGRGSCAALLAQLNNLRGDGLGAAQWADRALASTDLTPEVVDTTRAARAAGLALVGRMEEALTSLADLPTDPRRCGADQEHQLLARGALRLAGDDLARARADLEALVNRSIEMAPQRLLGMGVLAEAYFRLGRWDDALIQAGHAISLAEAAEQVWVHGFLATQAAQVNAGRGDRLVAEQHLTTARELAERHEDLATYAACENVGVFLAVCCSEPALAVERAQVLAFFSEAPTSAPGWLSWPGHRVSALVELGRLDEAEQAIVPLEEAARARGSRSRLATLARVRGELATARREHAEARERFEEALAVGAGAVDALEAGLVLTSYGRFLRRRGERRAAQERLGAAREMFLALGATPFVARCDEELAATGLAPMPAAPAATTLLTPQEQLIAGLATKGLSNQQIAHQLVLSVKTVGYHLGNVYAKLDVHSRAQLVARMGGH